MTDQPASEPSAAPGASLDPGAVEQELDDVARALDRLDDGSYGTCEVCGGVLDDEVLAVEPAARFCADHRPGG